MKVQVQNMHGTCRISDGGWNVQGRIHNPQSAIRNPQSRRGFTLIELMLVLVILATLAAIVTPRLTGQSKRAKVIAAQAQIADMGTALDAFEIGVGRYPTTVEGLQALTPATDLGGPGLAGTVPQQERRTSRPLGQRIPIPVPGPIQPGRL